jgi:hypothetical protein
MRHWRELLVLAMVLGWFATARLNLPYDHSTLVASAAQSCLPPPDQLVAWWPGNGSPADIVGGHHGTLHNGASFAPGLVGQAFRFDGIDDFVQIADAPALRPARISIAVWVQFQGLDSNTSGLAQPGTQYLVFKKNSRDSNFEGYELSKHRFDGAEVTHFMVTSAAGEQVGPTSGKPIVIGSWYHLAGTYDGSMVRFYINGMLEEARPASFPLDFGTTPLFFGQTGVAAFDGKLNGLLDEVELYSRALTSAEILGLYQAGSAGKCQPGGTLTPTRTATTQPSPTATLSAIQTVTTTPVTTGGREFRLTSQGGGLVRLDWATGTGQTGYRLNRITPTGMVVLAPNLPTTATAFTDNVGSAIATACYHLEVLGAANVVVDRSDVLCVFVNLAGGRAPVRNTAINTTDTGVVSLRWDAPTSGGQIGYLIIPLGREPLPVLAADATQAMHAPRAGACYLVLTLMPDGASVPVRIGGFGDIVCAAPGP